MMSLMKKNIVITGAGRGIGRQIAINASKNGANIALIARTESELNQTRDLLSGNGNHKCYILDISIQTQTKKTFENIFHDYKNIDGLVNNAGIQKPIGPFHEVSLQEWIYNIEVNLFGTLSCTKEVLRHMVSASKGKIVNLSGGGSTSPRVNFSAYGIAKTAVVRFTETLALELKSFHIDVNAIAPGAVNTKMLDEILENRSATGVEYIDAIKRKEKGGNSPSTAADLVCYLLSKESDGITGKLISAPWDPWQTLEFQNQLRQDRDLATLRRIDNKTFFKKI